MKEMKMKYPKNWERTSASLKRWVSTKLISKLLGKMISRTKGWDRSGVAKTSWEKSWIMPSRNQLSITFLPIVFGLSVFQASSREWDLWLELRSNPHFLITLLHSPYSWILSHCRWSHPPWPKSWRISLNWVTCGSLGFSSMKCSSNGMPSELVNTLQTLWTFLMVVSFGSPFSRLFSSRFHQVKLTCRLSGLSECLELSEYLELQDCWEL